MPRELVRRLERALAIDPAERFATIADLAAALDAIVEAPRRRRARAVGWVAAVAVIFAGGVLLQRPVPESAVSPQAVRRFIVPVDGSSVDGFAISPDGALAWVETGQGGDTLVMKPLGEFTGRTIYRAASLRHPFFSPDGRWVGFSEGIGTLGADRMLRVPADGGEPVPICDLTANADARWLADGTIVFTAHGDLWRVPESGSVPTRLYESSVADAEHLSHPSVLEDGTLVVNRSRRGHPAELVWLSPDGTLTPVERNATRGRYVDGRLLFVRDGTIVTRAFDSARKTPHGPTVPVADSAYADEFDVSRTGALVYRTVPAEVVEESGLRAVWIDRRTGVETLLALPALQYRRYAWRLSPAGDRVIAALPRQPDYFGRSKQDGTVWIGDAIEGRLSQLTSDDTLPIAWSPDGRSVTIKTREGHLVRRWIDDARPDEIVARAEAGPFGNRGTWSPDGRALVVQRQSHRADQADLWAVTFASADAVGREPPLVTPFAAGPFEQFAPAFSPDGRWVAYQSDESGRDEIYVRPFPGPGPPIRISPTGGRSPRWKGQEIFYERREQGGRREIIAVSIALSPDIHAGVPERVLANVEFESFDISPDGQRFLLLVGTPLRPTQLNLVFHGF